MSDERLRQAFDRLGTVLEPRAEYADALFDRLQDEMGRSRGRRGRIRPPRQRRVWAIAAALVVAMVGIAVVLVPLSNLGDRDKPVSMGPFGAMPPFSIVLERHIPPEAVAQIAAQVADEANDPPPAGPFVEDVVSYRLSYDGARRWRIDYLGESNPENFPDGYSVLGLPSGSFELFDGERTWAYDAGTNTYSKSEASDRPLPFTTWDATDGATRFWDDRCNSTPTFVGIETVAGVETRHVLCDRYQLWVDPGTGLVVKQWLDSVGDPAYASPLPFWPGIVSGETQLAAQLEYDPPFSNDTFSFVPPEGAVSDRGAYDQTPPTTLTLGRPVPDIELPLLGGGMFDLSALSGRPTALWFWAEWCEPCIGTPLDAFDAASSERADEVNLITVATMTDASQTRRYLADHAYRVPVALDADGVIANDVVGAEGIPLLLLIDADGNLVGAYSGWDERGTAEDMNAVLDALIAGETTLPDIIGVKEQS